jgi:hypothetical protein
MSVWHKSIGGSLYTLTLDYLRGAVMCNLKVSGTKVGTKQVTRTAMAFGLSLAMIHGTASYSSAQAAAAPIPSSASQAARVAHSVAKLADGVYLYGDTNQPDQLGQSYFVFEVTQGKVLGAMYMPQSSFDCAHGSFQYEQLALKVRDAYDKTASDYAIALDRSAPVASTNLNGVVPVGLSGLQKLDKVSQNDMRLLNTCKATFQAKAW